MTRRPWWRFFVILPEDEKELEKVFKLNLLALAALAAIAGYFLAQLVTATKEIEVLRNGFFFIAIILLILPLFPDNLLSSIEYRARKKIH